MARLKILENNTQKTGIPLLGPCTLLLTVFTILIHFSFSLVWIPLVAIVGIPICWKWDLKGFSVSLALLTLILIYQMWKIPNEKLWQSGIGFSMALGFLITALSSLEAIESDQEHTYSRDEHERLLQACNTMETNAKSQSDELEQTRKQVVILNHQLEELLATFRSESTAKQNEYAQLNTALVLKDRELRSITGKHKQLLEQFNGKSDILDETRHELFHTQETLYRLQRELQEEESNWLCNAETLLNDHFNELENTYKQTTLEQNCELEELYDLISHLFKNEQNTAGPLPQQYLPRKSKEQRDRIPSNTRSPDGNLAEDRVEHHPRIEGSKVAPQTDRVRKLLLASRATSNGKSADR